MSAIRAKFVVETVTRNRSGQEIVAMHAVCDDGIAENQRFHNWTPCGRLEMTIDNPSAQGVLTPGKAFYVDLTDAPSRVK